MAELVVMEGGGEGGKPEQWTPLRPPLDAWAICAQHWGPKVASRLFSLDPEDAA